MTLKTEIIADLPVFFNSDEFGNSAVWTPKGGVAQPAFVVILDDTVLHGDEDQEKDVIQESIVVRGATSDLSGVKARDSLLITSLIGSVNYEVINDAYPDEEKSGESIIDLRRSIRNRTKI